MGMRKRSTVTAILIGGMALLGASSARAVTLLSLINPPAQTQTPYILDFTATAASTTISIGGYQDLAYEYVSDISVTSGGGANMLGGTWTFTKASSGSDAKTQNDGTSVPSLWFGGFKENYDSFSQAFMTTPGVTYLLGFNFTNDTLFDPSALMVTTSGSLAVATQALAAPEPTTWTMALLGFVGLGLVGYRHGRNAQSPT
jgi:hypothetical protein